MVQSKAKTVDAYVAEADDRRRPVLERIREVAAEALPGWREGMGYGMAGWFRDGAEQPTISLANQKGYIAVYIGGGTYERQADAMKGQDYGKSCLRFKKPEAVDYDLLRTLMADRAAHPGEGGGC